MKQSLTSRVIVAGAHAVDRAVGWHRLPRPLGILAFVGLRERMREKNLVDCGGGDWIEPLKPNVDGIPYRVARTTDGTFNDLTNVRTGAQQCRFGRNVSRRLSPRELGQDKLFPSPREISNKLLQRRSFEPATTLNVLAAAWIQFEVHDWFSHGKNPGGGYLEIPLAPGDGWHENPMRIQPTRPDPSPDGEPGLRPTYRTAETHWWDASQLYGRAPDWTNLIRLGDGSGKVEVENDMMSAEAQKHLDPADQGGAFWLGLGLLHGLFMKEHNAICERLRWAYPRWSDDELFHQARLVNAALMAKIHTVEWTSAILDHPTTRWGSRINWWGLAGEKVKRRFGRLSDDEVISGIPGGPTNNHGVPFALTEEFVAVYRMHPLLPDEFTFWSSEDGEEIARFGFADIDADQARDAVQKLKATNCLYSFGISHPGAIALHNYPEFLRRFERPLSDGDEDEGQLRLVDLAAVDILRDRERGVPRYNEFRREFGLRPAKDFNDLTKDEELAKEIEEAYHGDIEKVDLMIGLYAEPRPKGFAISDTAFRVFILMASRRLECDRFLSSDYTKQIYTPEGLRWVEDNTFASVLCRHHPQLEPALRGMTNAFKPWNRVGSGSVVR